MAITIVQSASGGGLYTTSGTAFGVTLSSAPTQGNLLYAFGASDGLNPGTGTLYSQAGRLSGTTADNLTYFKYVTASNPAAQTPIFASAEASVYCTAALYELAGASTTAAFNVTSYNTNKAPVSNTYTAQSITPLYNGAVFCTFAIEDYAGITGASCSTTGFSIAGPFAQNGGATGTNHPIKLYILYNLSAVAGTAYAPVLTYTGTPDNTSATVQSVAISAATPILETLNAQFRLLNLIH